MVNEPVLALRPGDSRVRAQLDEPAESLKKEALEIVARHGA